MYGRVIWSEKYDPNTSRIHTLNDIDVRAPSDVIWKLLARPRIGRAISCRGAPKAAA
jgi:hypothetical protein